MKRKIIRVSTFLLLTVLLIGFKSTAQLNGAFTVGGDFNSFYPVVFRDAGWGMHEETVFSIGRSNVHENSTWRGSLSSKFILHNTNYGHGAQHINCSIYSGTAVFIAGWTDGTSGGGAGAIIWLRGGATTYHYNTNYALTPVVYDTPSGYNETYGGTFITHLPKTSVDTYVNSNGYSFQGSASFAAALKIGANATDPKNTEGVMSLGNSTVNFTPNSANYSTTGTTLLMTALDYSTIGFHDVNARVDFIRAGNGTIQLGFNGGWGEANIGLPGNGIWNAAGNVGIGTSVVPTGYKMVVDGKIGARKVVVSQLSPWPDYVFSPNYKLISLPDLETLINKNKHLPGVPSAAKVAKEGVDIGDTQALLLKKIEELTLYVITINKKVEALSKENKLLRKK